MRERADDSIGGLMPAKGALVLLGFRWRCGLVSCGGDGGTVIIMHGSAAEER